MFVTFRLIMLVFLMWRCAQGLQLFLSQMTCPAHVHHVRVGSSGTIKFEVNPSVMTQKVLEQVGAEAERYGMTPDPWTHRQRKRVIVEFRWVEQMPNWSS